MTLPWHLTIKDSKIWLTKMVVYSVIQQVALLCMALYLITARYYDLFELTEIMNLFIYIFFGIKLESILLDENNESTNKVLGGELLFACQRSHNNAIYLLYILA